MMDKQTTMQKNNLEINIAEMKIGSSPDILITRGLGSCLGITMYDPLRKIGAMAHAMLPDIENAKIKTNPCRFVNSVIKKMIEDLESQGASKFRIVAKLFGGAHMFSFITSDNILNVGQKNIDCAIKILKEINIKILAQEVGGTFGRTIAFDLESGDVRVHTISQGEKVV